MLTGTTYSALLALAALGLAQPAWSQAQPYPRTGFRATLQTHAHNVQGTVTIVDADTLLIEQFHYDGGGISVYFYLGAQNTPASFSGGLQIGPQLLGTVFNNASFMIDLPAGATLDNYNAVSVWCVAANASFGEGAFAAQPPSEYCSAKLNSQGCTPQIQFTGSPSATSAAPFSVGAAQMISNKSGLLLYGQSSSNAPFAGGVLCVGTPLRRTAVQNSNGNPGASDCSGNYSFDFQALIQSGIDPALAPGALVYAQYWQRDPQATFGVGLSDGLAFRIQP